jgi:uncharacterized membrane protein YcaP (DUF421 family)
LKNSIKILSLSIVGLAVVISFFGYQVYQINQNLSILKSNLASSQQTNPNGDNQASQELSNNEVNGQSEEANGAGGGGAGGGSESQGSSQDPIASAFMPDPSSLLSVIIRTSIIALLVFVIVKWLGGKGIGQLSPFGLLIVVGLGSAIGDPMIYNEVSIPQAMVAVIIVVIFFKIIDYLTLRSKRFRESVEPNPILLVDHGQISKIGLEKAKMDKEEFKVEMRLAGIERESEIKFARLEPNGKISFILRNKDIYSNTD